MDKEEKERVVNPETAKHELWVLVTSDDGDSIKLFPELKAYDDMIRESSTFCLRELEAIHKSKKDQIIESNKLLQFVPVDIIGNVNRLLLTWDHCVIERFPPEVFVFEVLQELWIHSRTIKSGGDFLRSIPQEIGDLKNLRILKITDCHCLKDLPSEIGNLENLEELAISECSSLEHLPSELGNLKRLRRLKIAGCHFLRDLPSTIGNLESLEELSVYGCRNLTQFPSEVSNLKLLHKLTIVLIDTFWNGTENFMLRCTNLVNLQEMRVYCCINLVNLPPEIGNLRCLRKLWIEQCRNLKNLPPEIGDLECLQEMVITGCIRIKNLPSEIGNLKCLRKLEITMWKLDSPDKHLLHSIPLEIGNLVSLQEFDISYCGRLDRLALVINKLKCRLQQLSIDYSSCYDLDYKDHSLTSFTRNVIFDVEFNMTLEELDFRVNSESTVDNIENLNNVFQSFAAENSALSPMSSFLPQGIRYIYVEISDMSPGKINEETIRKLLQKYPRLGKICFLQENISNHFSADMLHLMYFNRFGRSLQYEASKSGDRSLPSLLAENVWPIILEEAQTRIRNDFNEIAESTNPKNPTTIGASVIYSIIRELVLPLLVEL